ncbi:MAG: Two-component sensor histidine kinase [Flavobacteriaceae bacterium FS1-H7996/R]|nr:MAG: Two-component sensor histidine kinase [Flavobacteriaceae bacterium FS1-H7996/R]
MAYKQMMLTQKSAEIMLHTLHVYNALGDLGTHCTKAESEEFRKDLLKSTPFSSVLESYKAEGRAIIDTLRVLTEDSSLQKLRLKLLSDLLDKLNDDLLSLDVVNQQKGKKTFQALELQKIEISKTLNDIRTIRDRMLADEKRFMHNRKANYILHKTLTPALLLGMAFFALVVFVISFFRIYFTKIKVRKSEAFLKSVLANTDNIVNYYEPVFNKNNEITNFKILYANDCNHDYLGLKPDEILDKTILGMYPLHRSYEELKELIQSYNEQSKVIFNREIIIDDKKMWFHSLATPLNGGILVTSRNSTPEEEAKKIELTLKKRLENQNLKLLDNRAFLTNIFKSISDIVMHFKSIRDENDKIIDFEILFTNERISTITRDTAEEIKNKKVSDIYPNLFKSSVFEYLVHAIENDKPIEYEVPFNIGGRNYWFHATAIKLGDGVTVTIRDITDEKEKADKIIQLNEELVIQNSILTDAEHIAKTGSFIWYLDNGTAEISDNFYYMLGYAPKEFEVTYERYRRFVHPDDLDEFDKNEQKALKESYTEETTYRVITKQGAIKYFKTNGQFTLKKGNKVMIGVVQDVTQTIEAEERLLKSNVALKNSNAELESFSRIASHDLQEPLRKIQLFVLRIEDLDGNTLSDKSKEYFRKVTNAATRMQSLIQNLLAYSRIDSSKKDFEKVDLNQVLNKVKDDLVTAINDSNAEVVSDKLPKIKGVVFQIEQLFTNIISNALKYRNMSEPTKIQIKYKKVNAKDVPSLFKTSKKFYHKISFLDNGIGFDSQHAEKIFEVFQRLHQKTEYSGTGIGLAICKKIVENHNGYILAKGSTGIGAEFVVYLPV